MYAERQLRPPFRPVGGIKIYICVFSEALESVFSVSFFGLLAGFLGSFCCIGVLVDRCPVWISPGGNY